MKENTTNLKQSDRERELQMYPLDSWAIITKKQNENEKPTMNLKRSCCLAGGERGEIRIGNVKVDVCVCILLNTYYFHTYHWTGRANQIPTPSTTTDGIQFQFLIN